MVVSLFSYGIGDSRSTAPIFPEKIKAETNLKARFRFSNTTFPQSLMEVFACS
ncbi:hypothetical protein EVA_03692 [gut metagenome]|uniref:Uncharacterized protein n=1 Tax=gut metagenome TaxID=749906 RepID=J9GK96_9ZZZZ